ncbi:hypothetical protein MKX01_027568 [Papaver californicum]|nr:hypothetical protein MKX01_027568 [Papaver californicum]
MEGYVFSGDTAQTIARGIDFRFEDIYKRRISDTFHLNQNFHTHAGFLKLSQSVLDLLYHFFPLCVDKLSAETSLITGEAPVLLEPENQGNPSLTIFDNGVDVSGSIIGDDSSKKEICSHIGKKALILTIVESKGLESQNWRLVYGYMKEKNLFDSTNIDSFPLWVYENIGEFSNPIFDYWKKLQVVQVKTLDESLAHEMRLTSNSFKEKFAKAAGFRASADSMWGSKSESSRVALSESASIYEAIGKFELASKCLIRSMEYKRAGMNYRLFSHQNSKVFISTSTFI